MTAVTVPNWLMVSGLLYTFCGLLVLTSGLSAGSWWGHREEERGNLARSYQRVAAATSGILIVAGLGQQLVGQFYVLPFSAPIVLSLLTLSLFLLVFVLTADMFAELPAFGHVATDSLVDAGQNPEVAMGDGSIGAGRLRIAR